MPAVSLRPENKLLLYCARTDLDAAGVKRIKALLQAALDWTYLTETALRHGVLPLLYLSLSTSAPDAAPETILAQLRDQFQSNAQGNLFLTGALLNLLKRFEAHQIPAIPYKGPVLAASVYGNLSLRQFGDLDILVHERDVERAKALLVAEGYRSQFSLPWEDHFVRADGRVEIDLHWDITPQEIDSACVSFPFDLEAVWERLEPVTVSGMTFNHFSAEDFLLIRCQDGIKEYFKDDWPKLQWICDVAELVRTHQEMDWERVMAQARDLGSQRVLFLCLSLAKDLLGAPLPQKVERKMRRDRSLKALVAEVCGRLFCGNDGSRSRFFDPRHGRLERHRFQIKLKERWQDKLSHYRYIIDHYRRRARKTLMKEDERAHLPGPVRLSLSLLYHLVQLGRNLPPVK